MAEKSDGPKPASGQSEESLDPSELSLDELQSTVGPATGGTVTVRDPVWLTHFRLHHRQARRYRSGVAEDRNMVR